MLSFFRRKKDAAPSFISSVEEKKGLRIIRLKGAFDMTVIPEAEKFRKKVEAHPHFRLKNTLVDFKEVPHIDSAAVAAIVETLSELKHSHHILGLINLKDSFRGEFEILKVDKMIVEYATESDAIQGLAGV